MQKSAVPVAHGYPNPFYGRVQLLLEKQTELQKLVAEVKVVGRKHKKGHQWDFASVLNDLETTDVKERLRAVWEMMKTGKTEPVLGPPPRPADLYGRFGEGCKILDIGSGNCSKLTRFTGSLKITACDKKPIDTKLVVRKLVGGIEDNMDKIQGNFLTSFMSLTQVNPDTVKLLLQFDGLHLIPDLPLLEGNSVAVKQEDGRYKVNTLKGPFVDHPLDMPGMAVRVGYKLCPVYEETDIDVSLTAETSSGESPQIDATPEGIEDINYEDVTYKYDGVAVELELHGGQAYLTNRAEESRIGLTDFDKHLCVHLEDMGHYYVLLRVLAYKGLVPPHCGDTLRLFATKVRIRINGNPVIGPEAWDFRSEPGFPCDGLISRRGERDYYVKPHWTVDLYGESKDKIADALSNKGYRLDADMQSGLWEYKLSRKEADITLTPIKPRRDKKKATTVETLLYLLEKKTLMELEALTGTPWKKH